MSSNFNNAKIINVYYNKGDRKPYDVNGKPIAYIGEEFVGANEATEIRFFFGEELDSASAIIVAKRANNDTRLDPLELVGTGVNAYFKIRLNAWYAEYKGKMTIIFKVYNGTVTYDDAENPTQIVSTNGQIIVSDIFNLEVAYAPNASSLVPPFQTEDYDDWFFTLSTKLDKAQSITVTGALPTLTGDVYDDRYFYVEDEGVGRLYYINGSTAIEVVWGIGTLALASNGNEDINVGTNAGKMYWDSDRGTIIAGLYDDQEAGIGDSLFFFGKATEAIAKGEVVQFAGNTGGNIRIKKAVFAEISAQPDLLMGVAKHDIALNDFGYVVSFGYVRNLNTTAFTTPILYLSTSVDGALSSTKPTTGFKGSIAAVARPSTDGANGFLIVRPNLVKGIGDLADVTITTATSGQILSFDGSKWVNSNRLTTAETDIDALEGRMTTAEGDIDSLEGRMTTAETDITNIENGTTIVPKANADKDNNEFDATYLKKASATATYIPLSQKGVANGVAPLGADNKILSIHLPGGVDDIKEFADVASFPDPGEASIIYVALDTNVIYRWSGTAYVEISSSLALGSTASTAYRGDLGVALEGAVNTANQVDTGVLTWNATTGKFVSANNFVKTSAGNVGIGTTSPQAKLDVDTTDPINQRWSRGSTFYLDLKQTVTLGNVRWNFSQVNGGVAYNDVLVLDTGKVGIGTTSPATPLHVIGSIRTQGTTGASSPELSLLSAGFYTWRLRADGNNLRVMTDDITVATVTNTGGATFTGNVGIGTTSPSSRLEIQGAGTTASGYTSAGNAGLKLDFGTATNGIINLVGGGELGIYHSNSSGAYDVGIGFGTNADRILRFDTAGAEKMRILANGNVGIGTASPIDLVGAGYRTLAVSGTTTGALIDLMVGGSRLGAIYADTNVTAVGSLINVPLLLTTNDTERMRITGAGNVGIGTSSPATTLVVATSSNTNGLQIRRNSFDNNDYALLGFRISTAELADNLAEIRGLRTNRVNSGDTDLVFTTSIGGATPTEKLRIRDNGNVGIGTTAPSELLHLRSATPTQLIENSGGTGILKFTSGGNINYIQSGLVPTTASNAPLYFTNYNGANTRMVITGDGLVGINETSPTAQLQVKSGGTERVALIVNALASTSVNLTEWKLNGVNKAFIENGGLIATAEGIRNLSSINNGWVFTDTTGTTISRNVADTNPALIVNLVNAGATGNIQVWQKAGSALSQISNAGIFVGQSRPTRTDITANATLALADEGKVLRVNPTTAADNITITIPKNSAVAFPVDTEIAIVRYNSGTVSIAPVDGDVTLQSANAERKIKNRYGSVALKKVATDEWVLVGSLEA
jgi:hypothetical protein